MLAHLLLVLVASAVELPSETSLAKLVQDYSQLGPSHLTGSSADEATSNWIYQELQAAGLEVQFQAYTLPGPAVWVPQHDGAAGGGYGCQLVVDLHRIPCYVVQQPPMRPAVLDDVPMKRVLVVSSAKVYVLKAEEVYRSYLKPDGTLPYDAVIVINNSSLKNVTQPRPFDWDQHICAPALVPVVTVSNAFQKLLRSASYLTSLKLLGDHRTLTSRNVLAQLPATPGCLVAPPLYIGTPINGFFGAAGERGAGIALLLALAKGLVEPCGCRSWQPIFGFTSGHEQFDTGISEGAIPFLKSLAESRNLSLVEVPFISIGADLAGYARFEGQNSEGPGSGTLPVVMSTSQGPDSPGRMILDDLLRKLRPLPRFVHLKPGVMNATNTIGAIEKALHSGMPAMNVVGSPLGERFHLPSDADNTSVNFTSLLALAEGMLQALQSTICGSPRHFAPNMLHWPSVNRWLMLSLLTLATVPLVCRFTFKISHSSRREVQIEDAQGHPQAMWRFKCRAMLPA